MKTKKGAPIPEPVEVCPDGRQKYALTPCGAPLNPSVIRGYLITRILYHDRKKPSRKHSDNLSPFLTAFHVYLDKKLKKAAILVQKKRTAAPLPQHVYDTTAAAGCQ